MICPLQLLALVWVTGMALDIEPTVESLARLTGRDPMGMCEGCRARHVAHLRTAAEWAVLGAAGWPLMILATSALWWVRPVVPLVHRLTGWPRWRPCVGSSCAAHQRFSCEAQA